MLPRLSASTLFLSRYIFTHRALPTNIDERRSRVQVWARRHLKCKFIQLWNRAERWSMRWWCMTKFIFFLTEQAIFLRFSQFEWSREAPGDGWKVSQRPFRFWHHMTQWMKSHCDFLIAYQQRVFPLFPIWPFTLSQRTRFVSSTDGFLFGILIIELPAAKRECSDGRFPQTVNSLGDSQWASPEAVYWLC